jgi:hypothetical protein
METTPFELGLYATAGVLGICIPAFIMILIFRWSEVIKECIDQWNKRREAKFVDRNMRKLSYSIKIPYVDIVQAPNLKQYMKSKRAQMLKEALNVMCIETYMTLTRLPDDPDHANFEISLLVVSQK